MRFHKGMMLRTITFMRFRILLFVMTLLVVTSAASSLSVRDCHASEKIIAVVGTTRFFESDLERALSRYIPSGSIHSLVDRSGNREIREKALNDMIEKELFFKESVKRLLIIEDEEIDIIEHKNIEQRGSEQKFEDALTQWGLTKQSFRQEIRKTLGANRLLEQLWSESEHHEDSVRDYYNANRSIYQRPEAMRIFHILIQVEPSAPADQWKRKESSARDILEQLKAGGDFSSIAYEHSDDSYRYKNGDLGFIHRGRLTPEELDEAAFSLKEGEISDIVKTIYGFHILKAGEKRSPEIMSFAEVKEKLKKELEKKTFEAKKKKILEQMKKEYPVEIYLTADEKG